MNEIKRVFGNGPQLAVQHAHDLFLYKVALNQRHIYHGGTHHIYTWESKGNILINMVGK